MLSDHVTNHFLIIQYNEQTQTIQLENESYTVGRYSQNSIVLESPKISRHHAILVRKRDSETQEDAYWILDGDLKGNRSYNGIYINGKQCLYQKLNSGDLINFGNEINATYQTAPILSNSILVETPQLVSQKSSLVFGHETNPGDLAKSTFQSIVYYDTLTGLPNQSLFGEHATMAFANANRLNHVMFFFWIEIPNFSHLKHSLGVAGSEQLIRQFADRLNSCLRKTDLVAYWKNYQFAILLPNVSGIEDGFHVSKRILESLRSPFEITQQSIQITFKMGITRYPEQGQDLKTLLQQAQSNAILYQPQKQIASSNSQPSISQNKEIEYQLEQAFKNKELSLLYLPQIGLKDGQVYSMEALIQWQHPTKGIIDVEPLIPLVEKTEFLTMLHDWLLEKTGQQNKIWRDFDLKHVTISLNIPQNLFYQDNLLLRLSQKIEKLAIDASLFELEITAKTLFTNLEYSCILLNQLKEAGFQITMDDFDGSYESLSYLEKLPLSTLKIAPSQIKNLEDSLQNVSLISAIIAVGRSLNFRMVAKGVETQQQFELLRQMQCDAMQGYQSSRPLSAPKATQFLLFHQVQSS